MRIVITSDLHFGLTADGDESSREMARRICGMGADVLVLAGDNAAMEEDLFRGCFQLFDDFRGARFFIAGNHDLWTRTGDSYAIYTDTLEKLGRDCGFQYLDAAPVVIGRTGIAGSVGWYDYAFKDPGLHVGESILRSKKLPGFVVWMDGENVKWRFDDKEFTRLVVEKLDRHLADIEPQCSTIVAVTHHLPFEEFVIRKPSDIGWSFGNAFMGSPALGDVLLKHDKVRHAFCGHSHQQRRLTRGPIQAVMIGSTYRVKAFEVLDLPD